MGRSPRAPWEREGSCRPFPWETVREGGSLLPSCGSSPCHRERERAVAVERERAVGVEREREASVLGGRRLSLVRPLGWRSRDVVRYRERGVKTLSLCIYT